MCFQKKLMPNQSGGLEGISASRNHETTAKDLVGLDHKSSENADMGGFWECVGKRKCLSNHLITVLEQKIQKTEDKILSLGQ